MSYHNIMDSTFRMEFEHRQLLPVNATPTPLPSWNEHCRDDGGKVGIAKGWFVVVGGNPKFGKALGVDTPIPTPSGWVAMGDLSVGDEVFGADGSPVAVVATSPTYTDHECYEVTIGGEKIVADAGHRWLVWRRDNPAGRGYRLLTTRELYDDQRWDVNARPRFSIPTCDPIRAPDADLPIEPYLLGYWLGDGTRGTGELTIGEVDAPDVVQRLVGLGADVRGLVSANRYSVNARRGRANPSKLTYSDAVAIRASADSGVAVAARYGVSTSMVSMVRSEKAWKTRSGDWRPSLKVLLRDLGVLRDKHVPEPYMRASPEQRLELLRGLMDSDGCCGEGGTCEFTSTSERLARGAFELMCSLGLSPSLTEGRATLYGKDCGPKYRVHVRAYRDTPLFHLGRKAERQPVRPTLGQQRRTTHRPITRIEKVSSVPVRCIQVGSESHDFLCGRQMVPTHNSILALNMAKHAMGVGEYVGFMSLEMKAPALAARFYAMMTGTPVWKLEKGGFRKDHFDEVWKQMSPLQNEHNFLVNDTPIAHLDEVMAGMAEMADVGVEWFVVDYLQLVGLGDEEKINKAVTATTSKLRYFSHSREVTVIALSQFNRETSKNYDSPPTVQGLHGGMIVEATADQILLLDHSRYERDGRKAMTYVELTNRHGEGGEIPVEWDYETLSIREGMADEVDRFWP